jgi:glutamate carboxypeptidase
VPVEVDPLLLIVLIVLIVAIRYDGRMPQPTAAVLLAHLRRQEDAMADLLADLARLESPSSVPASQGAILGRLAAELQGAGMRVRRLAGKESGGLLYAVARSGSMAGWGEPPAARVQAATMVAARGEVAGAQRGRPAQLLLGHCDTVWPIGMLATMPVERRDGRLYGPGVYDMKAGLVQAVFALRALGELRLSPPAVPVVLVNSDEETGSEESTRQIRRLARRMERVFVLEPSLGPRGALKSCRKGVGQFHVVVRGRAAHAGLDPERGASAVLELARVIERLYALADAARGITINVGVVSGGLRGNVVAPEAFAEVDVRVRDAADVTGLEAAVRGLTASTTPGTTVEIAGSIGRPPLHETAANRALRRQAEDAARQLGVDLDHGTAGGASDGNTTSQHTATLDGLGAVGGGAHALDEHVVLAALPERTALLALLLLAPLAASPSVPVPLPGVEVHA